MMPWNFTTPLTLLGCVIWNLCELLTINLGRFAPFVFGLAVGRRGRKKQ